MRQIPAWFVIVGFFVMLWVFFEFAVPVLHDVATRLAVRGF